MTGLDAGRLARHYDLNGLRLATEADRPGLGDFLDFVLVPFDAPATGRPDFRVTVETRDSLPALPDGVVQWAGSLPEGLASTLVRAGDRRCLHVPPHYQALSERDGARARVLVVPGSERWLGGSLAFWLIDEMMIGGGRQLVHAACLARDGGDAILIFAASGTGKTTTALALARNGYALVGDDAAVLEFRNGRPWVWGLPRPVNLHRRTATMLPWLSSQSWSDKDPDERRLPLSSATLFAVCAPSVARPCGGVVLLRSPGAGESEAAPLARPEALVEIAADNVRLAPGGLDEDGASLFEDLARLVAAVPAVSLRVGPDPGALQPMLLEAAGLVPARADESSPA